MLTSSELRQFLYEKEIAPLDASLIADEEYSLPDPDWVRQEFSRSLRSLQAALGLTRWSAESNDCDDFARMAAGLAQLLHNDTRPGKSALAVGEFWYTRDAGGGHAINLFIVLADGQHQLLFFEPQTGEERTLSAKEIASCSGYRF